ncbi:MAG: DUF4351 domain-containing protein [Comamonadaceae bacterium]|nr:DUF4351 domain-containing protein [Comamonadaceae bacterium]
MPDIPSHDQNFKNLILNHPQEDKTMTTLSQRMWSQGRQEGRQEDEATVLLRLLTRRFGPLGALMTQRVRQASSAELEQWADNILDASTLDEVFRAP